VLVFILKWATFRGVGAFEERCINAGTGEGTNHKSNINVGGGVGLSYSRWVLRDRVGAMVIEAEWKRVADANNCRRL